MERAPTVAVVTVAVGDRYQALLPQWAQAVAALDRQPDEIIIAADDIPDRIITQLELILRDFWIVPSGRTWEHHPQVLANDAIAASTADWICRMDVDDLIYPHALTPLDSCRSDVLCFGISINRERHLHPPPVTAGIILNAPHNLLFAGSPFRREAWQATPGYRDMIFDDWAFWRDLAANGCTFTRTGTIDYDYSWTPRSSTFSIEYEKEAQRVLSILH